MSFEGFLRFFAVWPPADDASFTDLRAVGAFLVSARHTAGLVGGVKVLSEAGLYCTFLSPWGSSKPAVQRGTGGAVMVERAPAPLGAPDLVLWRFATASGATYMIVPDVDRHNDGEHGRGDPAVYTGYPACSSDSDCFSHPLYRCVGCRYNASRPAGVCYPGSAGGAATCQCMAEAPGDQCGPTNFKPNPLSRLPRYLMVGDSISMGMVSDGTLFERLNASVQSVHSPGNACNANRGAHCIANWLDDCAFDVVSFNFGIHDISHDQEHLTSDAARVRNDARIGDRHLTRPGASDI